ncbi:MAG: NADP-dependent oxidoreductase [Actinomycetota bacterium]
MKAITVSQYGGPEVLSYTEMPEPLVSPSSVLIRTRAAGVNPVDWKIREGYLRGAFTHHEPVVPGWDVAGVVERVGSAVPEFAVGDEVCGYVRKDAIGEGTYAELVSADVRHIARKPSSLSFEAAASLPLAGLTAWQALDRARVDAGDVVVIHAAAGGVGHFAVQLAVARGARVIGTASVGNHDFLRSLGAEPVEYGAGLADRIRELASLGVGASLDLVGSAEALEVGAELVADRSRIVSIVDAPAVLKLGGQHVFVRPDAATLQRIVDLVDAGTIRVEVARTFPFADAAQAHRELEEGRVRGKLALTVP